MRRPAAALLATLLALSAPGPRAWAAALRVVPRVVSPVAGAAGAARGPALPSLTGSRLGVSPRVAPLSSAQLVPRLAPAAAPAAAASSPVAAAFVEPAALAAPAVARAQRTAPAASRDGLRASVNALARRAAPALRTAAAAGSSGAGLHSAGSELEALLTGQARVRAEGAVAARAQTGGRAHSDLILHHDEHEEDYGEHEHEPPAPEPTPEQKRQYRLYRFGTAAVKVGIELLHFAIPLLLITQFAAPKALVGGVVVAAEIAGMVAGGVSGPLIDRLKPPRVLAWTAALQGAAIGAIPLLYGLGLSPGVWAVGALFVAGGALGGVFDIARRAALPHILGRHPGTLREYNGDLYLYREGAAMSGDLGAGGLAKGFEWLGFAKGTAYALVLGLHPLAYAAAAVSYFRLAGLTPAYTPAAAVGKERASLGERLDSLLHGARIVLRSPRLLAAALVNIPVISLHKLFHTLVAAVYATEVLGSAALAAVLMFAWNAGEFAAAGFQKRYGRSEAGSPARLLIFGAVTGLSAWLLWAFPTIWVAAPVAFLLAAGTLGNELGLASFFGSAVEKDEVGAVNSFVYPLASGAALATVLGMGFLFDRYPPSVGMLALAVALTAVSGFYVLIARFLRASERAARHGRYDHHDHDH